MSAGGPTTRTTVLVHVLDHARPVSFAGRKSKLIAAIWKTFADVLKGKEQIFLQLLVHIIYKLLLV